MANDKQQSTLTLGLQIVESEEHGSIPTLLAALFAVEKNQPILKGLWRTPLGQEPIIEQLQATPSLVGAPPPASLLRALPVASVYSAQVLRRVIDLGAVKPSQVRSILPFQTEEQLPFSIEQAIFDWLPTPRNSQVHAFAIQEKALQEQIDFWQEKGLEIEQISQPVAALVSFANHLYPEERSHLICFVGQKESTVVLVRLGKLEDSQVAPKGCKDTEEELNQALSRAILAIRKKWFQKEHTPIFCTFLGYISADMEATLLQELKLSDCSLVENGEITEEAQKKWAVPIGLALGALEGVPQHGHLNLRQERFSFTNPWRHIWRPLARFFAICFATTAVFWLGSTLSTKRQLAHIKSDYVKIVHRMRMQPLQVETLFRKKENKPPLRATTEKQLLSSLSLNEIKKRISFLKLTLTEQTSPIALDAKIPKVRNVLAWLAKTPEFASKNLSLQEFDYNMISRPEKARPKIPYKVKVSLSFSAETAKGARSFHNRLLQPNDFVDPTQEVRWTTSSGLYQVSFILKDFTRYAN